VLEEESGSLRQELMELQERQDFTERALVQNPASAKSGLPPAQSARVVTPR
jgi:hypothetical protein